MCVRTNCFTVTRSISMFCLALLAARVIVAEAAEPESDHDLIQGHWVEHHQVRGITTGSSLTLTNGKLKGESSVIVVAGWTTGSYVVRTEENPKEIAIVSRSGVFMESGREVKRLGIYRIQGDKLTICESVTKRPTEFRTAPELDWVLREYTRWVYEVDPDLDKLVGQWRVVRSVGRLAISQTVSRVRDRNGWIEFARLPHLRDTPPGVDHGQAHVIKVNSLDASFRYDRGIEKKGSAPTSRKKPGKEGFSVMIDSSGTPKRVSPGTQAASGGGTYVLDGDMLTITLEGWKLVLQRKGE